MFTPDDQPKLPKVRPVFAWPGGKQKLLDHILPHIPPHSIYVEVFGGGLAVYTAKEPSDVEVVNDINGELISFYWCCKFHLEELLHELDLVLNSREVFRTYMAQKGITDIQRAARWFIRHKISFGGMGATFAVSRARPLGSRMNRIAAIRALNRRMDTTTIENVSWEKCLDLYDAPEAFFFMDPPYLDAGGDAYAGWTELELTRFAERVRRLQGKWLVTFQDCDVVRQAFGGYVIHEIDRARGINNQAKKKSVRYREVVITCERADAGGRKTKRA